MERQGPLSDPGLGEIFLRFLRLGLTAFGGPAMIPYIREASVDRKKWLEESDFSLGVAICQSIPGATAMQVAGYVGLRARGVTGALTSFSGFALPAFCLITLLSFLYLRFQNLPQVLAAFVGLKIIVVAIITNATLTFGQKSLRHWGDWFIGLTAGLLLFLRVNPIFVILGACGAGIFVYRRVQAAAPGTEDKKTRGNWPQVLLLTGILGCSLFLAGLYHNGLWELSVLMIKVDLFAFGGGYTSLPLMLHEVVQSRAWMDAKTFMDGIALGQVTPGPIVITAAFVGVYMFGLFGAVAGSVAIFSPSFLLLISVVPYFDRIQRSTFVQRMIRGSLASFVGLLGAVAVRFALSISWTWPGAVMAAAAFIALYKKVDILWVVLTGGGIAVLLWS